MSAAIEIGDSYKIYTGSRTIGEKQKISRAYAVSTSCAIHSGIQQQFNIQ